MVSHLCARFIHPTVNHTCLPKALGLVAYFFSPCDRMAATGQNTLFYGQNTYFLRSIFFLTVWLLNIQCICLPSVPGWCLCPTHLNKSIGCRALGARRLRLTDAVASGIGRGKVFVSDGQTMFSQLPGLWMDGVGTSYLLHPRSSWLKEPSVYTFLSCAWKCHLPTFVCSCLREHLISVFIKKFLYRFFFVNYLPMKCMVPTKFLLIETKSRHLLIGLHGLRAHN